MAPYAPSMPSFDSYTTPPIGNNCNKEDVIFSLTERLRARDSEIRQLKHENSELENQLNLRGNPIQLDVAYEELLSHLKSREADFRLETKKQEERQRDVERENRKLKDKIHASRKKMDELDRNSSMIRKETHQDVDELRQRLHISMGENQEKTRQIEDLEDMVDGLTAEVEQLKKGEDEDKILLNRLAERVKVHQDDQDELEASNEELQRRVETQRHLLQAKEVEIGQMEALRHQAEADLTDDLDAMRCSAEEIVDHLRAALEEREEEIHLLSRQCERYEDIIDEADYITHEQRAALHEKRREIEELRLAVEDVKNQNEQSGGILGTLGLDKMFACKPNSVPEVTPAKSGTRPEIRNPERAAEWSRSEVGNSRRITNW